MRDSKRHQQLLDGIAECRRAIAGLTRVTDHGRTANMLRQAAFELDSADQYIKSANRCARANMEELWLGIAEFEIRSARRYLDIVTEAPSNISTTTPTAAGARGS